jgi:hypothetical protein
VDAGVFVLGMHRSGTSAVTRLLSLLGPRTPPGHDLVQPTEKNPKGYWESETLVAFNERLLWAIDCDIDCPLPLEPGWESDPRLDDLRAEAPAILRSVFTSAPWVWKDPRLCLAFAFWRDALAVRPSVVLVNRNPLEITASALRIRSEQGQVYALALWERYLRQALTQSAGLPTFVTPYTDVLTDPVAWCARAHAFLASADVPSHPPREDEVLEFIDCGLRHTTFTSDDFAGDPTVSPQQRTLFAAIEELEGPHERFEPPELPPETPTTEALLAERRRGLKVKRELTRELERRAQWRARIARRLLRALPGR